MILKTRILNLRKWTDLKTFYLVEADFQNITTSSSNCLFKMLSTLTTMAIFGEVSFHQRIRELLSIAEVSYDNVFIQYNLHFHQKSYIQP